MPTHPRTVTPLPLRVALLAALLPACDAALAPAPPTAPTSAERGPLEPSPDENLGAFTAQVSWELGPLVPRPSGDGAVQLLFHYYRDAENNPWPDRPFDIVAVDLETGVATVQPADPAANRAAGFRVFASVFGPDDVLYMGTVGGQVVTPFGMDRTAILAFDWRTGASTLLGRVFSNGVLRQAVDASGNHIRASSYGPQTAWYGLDGAVYFGMAGMSTPVVRYDAATKALGTYGDTEVGIARSYYPAYNYYGCTDGEYLYVGNGKRPWAVVAVREADLRAATAGGVPYAPTAEQVLMTIPEEDLILPMIEQRATRCGLRLFHEPKDGAGSFNEYFHLANGQATRITAATLAQEKAIYESVPLRKPTFTLPAYEVLVDTTDATPFSSTARVWFRRKTTPASEWRSTTFPVNTNPWAIENLVALGPDRVVGYTGPYGAVFEHDVVTGEKRQLGPSTGNVYTMMVANGLVYLGGYAEGALEVYDPARPWTFKRGYPGDVITDARRADSNLRLIDRFGILMEGVTHLWHLAADYRGRIFGAGHAERVRVGGGLVIYDPATNAKSAITVPTFANDDPAGLAATGDGKYIVYASKVVADPNRPGETPTAARLFVYDAEADVMARVVTPFPGELSAGFLSTGPGTTVIGRTAGRIYAFDAATGTTLWERAVAVAHKRFITLDNGLVMGVLGLDVVTLDPATGASRVRHTITARSTGTAQDFAMAGEYAYFAFGTPDLFRSKIENSAPTGLGQRVSVAPGGRVDWVLEAADADGDPLLVEWLDAPTKGVRSGDGLFVGFDAAVDAAGEETLRYRLRDGFTTSAEVTVTVVFDPCLAGGCDVGADVAEEVAPDVEVVDTSVVDTSPEPDTMVPVDTSPEVAEDTMVLVDTSPEPDTSVLVDTSPEPDTTVLVDTSPEPDTTVLVDTSPEPDTSEPDTAVLVDTSPEADTSPEPDTTVLVDTSPEADTAVPADTSPERDTSPSEDTTTVADSSPPVASSGCEGGVSGTWLGLVALVGLVLRRKAFTGRGAFNR